MSDSSLGLSIAAFVITLSIFVLGLLYFTKIFSVRGTTVDHALISQSLQDKANAISLLRRTALKKRSIQDLKTEKANFKQLVSDYKNYTGSDDGSVVSKYLANVPKTNYSVNVERK
jgi:arginine deiminase